MTARYIGCGKGNRRTDEMTELTLEILRAELAPIQTRLGTIEARVAGLSLIGAAIETLRQDVRMLRTAINDMARDDD